MSETVPMDLSLLLDKAQVLTSWPQNIVLVACALALLLVWILVRLRRGGVVVSPEEQDEGESKSEVTSSSVEFLSVFQVISEILDHEAVQLKMVEEVFALLSQKVLLELEAVGVQGVSITVDETRFEAGVCGGDGWCFEQILLGVSSGRGILQFYGAKPETEYSPHKHEFCVHVAEYLAGRLSSFLFLKKSMQEVALFRHLIDQASEIILIIDPLNGKILEVNSRACIELGYAPHELARKRLSLILAPGKDDVFVENKSEKYGHEMFLETRLLRQDQTTLAVEMSLKNIDLDGRKYQLAIARDFSARNEMMQQKREMEEQRIQSEKMASVGQLSAGIAHEINNPISFISSNLGTMGGYVHDISRLLTEYRDFVRMVDFDDELLHEKHLALTTLEDEIEGGYLLRDLKAVVVESLEGAERIKCIIQDMKSFAHPGEDALTLTDINKGLASTLNLVLNELECPAELVQEYGKIEQVVCFAQQINQVFMNIIVNAGQAMEKEGAISVSTFQRRDLVHISITDNGRGMEKGVADRIFEPFFTTKDVGKGTGLGLNVAYNIIKKHEGRITVDSEVGTGTTFTIILPVKGPKRKP